MIIMQNFTVPTDGIRYKQCNVKAVINTKEMGKGTLFITDSLVSWGDENTLQGFSVEIPHILLQRLSKDPRTYPQEYLYLLLDNKIEKECSIKESDHQVTKDTEIRFYLDVNGILESISGAIGQDRARQDIDSESGEEKDFREPKVRDVAVMPEDAAQGISKLPVPETKESEGGEKDFREPKVRDVAVMPEEGESMDTEAGTENGAGGGSAHPVLMNHGDAEANVFKDKNNEVDVEKLLPFYLIGSWMWTSCAPSSTLMSSTPSSSGTTCL